MVQKNIKQTTKKKKKKKKNKRLVQKNLRPN